METVEPETTEVVEEKPEPRRSRKNLRVFAGLGGVIVIAGIVVLALFLQQRARRDPSSMLSVDDLTQQKYDLLEWEREKNKAAQLRDDPLLMRKDSESETASRLEGLLNQIEKKSGALPESPDNSQVLQEEEMIAHVMRRTPSPANRPPSSAVYQPTAQAELSEQGRLLRLIYTCCTIEVAGRHLEALFEDAAAGLLGTICQGTWGPVPRDQLWVSSLVAVAPTVAVPALESESLRC